MAFILMNKDTPWLLFSCERDEYDEVQLAELEWFTEKRPLGYSDLFSFLDRRKAPKHRKHIEQLLERYGCTEIDGFVRVTHAVSLNDTFWVKEESSSLKWYDISLYSNSFDEVIANAAFDGAMSDTDLSSTSPEFGTDGSYAKCWIREDDGIYLCKSGSATFELEPLSEYLASQLAEHICNDYVPYDMDFLHGKLVSKCCLFTDEKYGLVKAGRVVTGGKSISSLLAYFESIGSGDDFRRMCVFDSIILNIDRHLGNFGVLADNDTMEVIKMAPVFDNNRSLCFDLDNDQLKNIDWYLKKVKPSIGSDFIATARGLLTDEIRSELVNLKGFTFKQHPKINVDKERLDLLSEIVNRQIGRILT
ncbi:MAG: HipA protein [Oscillospiraceae bacterium]